MVADDRPTRTGERPFLQVITPSATEEEIAAVLAAMSALAAPTDDRPRPEDPVSTWAERDHTRRTAHRAWSPGPAGWRTFFWPR